jgi:uncharacterized BrkB/YihY/UPF0761 family membrane protein
MLVFTIIVSSLLAILGIVILVGKGDNLIAGYNTASEHERKKYHIKRLRGLIGGLLVAVALLYFWLMREHSLSAIVAFAVLSTVLAIVAITLANTWAKKK